MQEDEGVFEDAHLDYQEVVKPLIIMRDGVSRVTLLDTACTVHFPDIDGMEGRLKLQTFGASRAVQATMQFDTTISADRFLRADGQIFATGTAFSDEVRMAQTETVTSMDSLFEDGGRRIQVGGRAHPGRLSIRFNQHDATKTIIGHLYDLPNLRGAWTKVKSGSRTQTTRQRLELEVGGWEVLIDSFAPWILLHDDEAREEAAPTTDEWIGSVLSNPFFGGIIISHGIRARRTNGATFGTKAATTFLRRFELFLQFAFGRRVPIAYPFGLGAQDEKVWAQVDLAQTPRPVGSSLTSQSWSPFTADVPRISVRREDIKDLQSALTGFYALAANGGEVLPRAVEWYSAALTSKGTTACLVLAQAGLELLAFEHLSLTLGIREPSRQKIDASDQLRALLSHVGVPVELPDKLRQALPPAPNMDGPDWVTLGRNRAVHPAPAHGKAGLVQENHADLLEALALHYLELSLLRLIGYRGDYWNRIENVVDTVPWATTS